MEDQAVSSRSLLYHRLVEVLRRGMSSEHYTPCFYEALRDGSKRSAEVIVPLVLEFLPVRSVVDVGCGDGSWLAVLRRLGVTDVLGIDGEYVASDLLQIPREFFQAFDLTKPFTLGRTFDLAVSLEVGEHLPADSAATFVESLIRLAPAVLFSAAIPFQGGSHHVNEQWPDKWVALFRRHNYSAVDCIRKRVWENDAVEWWYAQNTLLFVRAELLEKNALLKSESERTNTNQLRLVHPRNYLEALIPLEPSFWGVRAASQLLVACIRNFVRTRLYRIVRKEAHSRSRKNRYCAISKRSVQD